ncbi:hypothetical protein N7537_006172 [Penicillium hordei]|uniref:Uncharacterized protein n=1 Tax=Penicillium hordei TaxID=40994 RepID=A0AAD6E768_9EURO|nr:uncharacterized protein N7537_006172 [Penicillium hordei]KAJ5603216.1 hypothetical protein N7537_006172 [Penicillium hordei]
MPRTNLKLRANMKETEDSLRRIWMPLRLDNSNHPQNALDRQSVINLIRSVYDPLLIAWLAELGHTWQNQFSRKVSGNEFQTQILARIGELPGGVQSIESETILGGILYDILRFYRFTDAAWRVPLSGAAAPPPPPPPPPAPASALAATTSEGSSGDVLVAANLEVLIDAATQVLGSTTSSEGLSGDVLSTTNLEVLIDAATQVLGPTGAAPTPLEILAEVASTAEPSPIVSPTSSLDILAAAVATRPYAPVPALAAAASPIDSPAPGAKRGRDDETEDESEQPAKKKQAVSPK